MLARNLQCIVHLSYTTISNTTLSLIHFPVDQRLQSPPNPLRRLLTLWRPVSELKEAVGEIGMMYPLDLIPCGLELVGVLDSDVSAGSQVSLISLRDHEGKYVQRTEAAREDYGWRDTFQFLDRLHARRSVGELALQV